MYIDIQLERVCLILINMNDVQNTEQKVCQQFIKAIVNSAQAPAAPALSIAMCLLLPRESEAPHR